MLSLRLPKPRYGIRPGEIGGYRKRGAGVGRTLKKITKAVNKVDKWVNKHNLVSKAGRLSELAGTTPMINAATNGAFSRIIDAGKKAGYGKVDPMDSLTRRLGVLAVKSKGSKSSGKKPRRVIKKYGGNKRRAYTK